MNDILGSGSSAFGVARVATLQVGVDIVEIARVESSIRRFGDRFRKRVYTPGELVETRENGPHSLLVSPPKRPRSRRLGPTRLPITRSR